jgi:Gas vesicle synthesis protein GvpL/GvpF
MMPWYVFALVDRPPAARRVRGLAGTLTARRVPGGFAILERRADVPPVELGALKTHDAVVSRVARAVPAILPVRFGTLLELDEIEAALEEREEEIAEAFDLVRDRVQFTWRGGRGAWGAEGAQGTRRADGALGAQGLAAAARSAKVAATAMSGAAYLRRAARAAKPEPPAVFSAVRNILRPVVANERYQAATPTLPHALYHLVERGKVERYRLLAGGLAAGSPVRVSGPFAPFAFTPDFL